MRRPQTAPQGERTCAMLASLLLLGCSSAESARPKPSAAPSRPTQAAAAPAAVAAETTATQAAPSTQAPSAEAAVALPDRVDGGDIERPLMLEVLASGIGRFLSRVRVTAERDERGRFAGWRLEHVFPDEPTQARVIRAGDTLLRVNGQSVERPEQLKTVWDSLVTSRELVLTVRRAGKQSEIRYRIVDPNASGEGDAAQTDAPAVAPSESATPATRATKHES